MLHDVIPIENPEFVSPRAVIGARWRTSSDVIDILEKCESIQDHVIEVAGLSTPGVRQLLFQARALLMPSFAEGFGLPIVEALAVWNAGDCFRFADAS